MLYLIYVIRLLEQGNKTVNLVGTRMSSIQCNLTSCPVLSYQRFVMKQTNHLSGNVTEFYKEDRQKVYICVVTLPD
jgi:hypothetical protein